MTLEIHSKDGVRVETKERILREPILDDQTKIDDMVKCIESNDISGLVGFIPGRTIEVLWRLDFDDGTHELCWLPAQIVGYVEGEMYKICDEDTSETMLVPLFYVRFDDDKEDSKVYLMTRHKLVNLNLGEEVDLSWRLVGDEWEGSESSSCMEDDEMVHEDIPHSDDCEGSCVFIGDSSDKKLLEATIRNIVTSNIMVKLDENREFYDSLPRVLQTDYGAFVLKIQRYLIEEIIGHIDKKQKLGTTTCIPLPTIEEMVGRIQTKMISE